MIDSAEEFFFCFVVVVVIFQLTNCSLGSASWKQPDHSLTRDWKTVPPARRCCVSVLGEGWGGGASEPQRSPTQAVSMHLLSLPSGPHRCAIERRLTSSAAREARTSFGATRLVRLATSRVSHRSARPEVLLGRVPRRSLPSFQGRLLFFPPVIVVYCFFSFFLFHLWISTHTLVDWSPAAL